MTTDTPTEELMAPEKVYQHPLEITADPDLTVEEKIAALEHWKHTLLDRIRSTGEGMAPPAGQTADEAATIEQISKALEVLRPSGEAGR